MNYYEQLCEMYPNKRELLWYVQFPLHHHLYAYGNQLRISYEEKSIRIALDTILLYFYKWYRQGSKHVMNSVVSSTHPIVEAAIKKEGFPVMLLMHCISFRSYLFLIGLNSINFIDLLSEKTEHRINAIKREMMLSFKKYQIRFLILHNDAMPMEKIAIKACKELGIPTGVFLHGLPGEYDTVDNFRCDYTFVWGDAIKNNYISVGCDKEIIVTGNPKYSEVKPLAGSHDNVVVISFCAGDVYDGASGLVADRGLCIQYANTVESILKKCGVKNAILRVHPHENIDWYQKFIDNDFYTLDSLPLLESLSRAKYLIGPASSVLVDAVSHDIPYYSYIITKDDNPHSWNIVPPFRKEDMPIAYTPNELLYNLKYKQYVQQKHISSYYAQKFDIKKITKCFLK